MSPEKTEKTPIPEKRSELTPEDILERMHYLGMTEVEMLQDLLSRPGAAEKLMDLMGKEIVRRVLESNK